MIRVAVVIPTYRRPDMVLRAARSALANERADLEVVVTVVDNGSPESPAARLRAAFGDRVRLLVNPTNLGVVANWNRCREVAQASSVDYWMLLEDDNYLEPEFLEKTVAALEAAPQADVAFTPCFEFDDSGDRRVWWTWSIRGGPLPGGLVPRRELLSWAFTCPMRISAALMRNTARLRGWPFFPNDVLGALDVAGLGPAVLRARGVIHVPEPLMNYYVNPKSVTATMRRDPRAALGELLRAFRVNAQLLQAAGDFTPGDWLSAAQNAPIDRLMLSALALSAPPRRGLRGVSGILVSVLTSRGHEIHGWKRFASRALGSLFWAAASLQAGRIARVMWSSPRSVDFDSEKR